MNDGDVVFKKGGFLEKYFEGFKEGYKIIGHQEYSIFPEHHFELIEGKKLATYYKRFIRELPEFPNKICAPRIHLMHTILDLDYFKSIDMLGDRLDKDVFAVMYGGLVDTGTDFYHRIVDNDIPLKWVEDSYVREILLHWGWLSSGNRDTKKLNANSSRNQVQEIEDVLYKEGLQKLTRELGIHPMKLVQSYKKTQNKSIWS